MVGAYCYAELGLLIRKVVLIMMMTINTKQLWIESLHQMIFDNNLLFCYSLEEITLISLTLWGPSSDLSGSLSITLSQGCHLKVGHLVVSKIKLSSWWSKILMIITWSGCGRSASSWGRAQRPLSHSPLPSTPSSCSSPSATLLMRGWHHQHHHRCHHHCRCRH